MSRLTQSSSSSIVVPIGHGSMEKCLIAYPGDTIRIFTVLCRYLPYPIYLPVGVCVGHNTCYQLSV